MRKFKNYDELLREVNASYKRTQNVRETANELDLSVSVIFEALGFKDELDFGYEDKE